MNFFVALEFLFLRVYVTWKYDFSFFLFFFFFLLLCHCYIMMTEINELKFFNVRVIQCILKLTKIVNS